MSKSSHSGNCSGQQLLLIALVGGVFFTVVSAAVGDGGSRCPDATCTPAPPGAQCNPKYERDDGCCPVWYCSNGQQAYGVSKSTGTGSSFSFSSGGSTGGVQQSGNSFSFSSGSSSGGQMAPMANPLAGMLGNMLGGMFG